MKIRFLALSLISSLLFSACSDINVTDMGSQLLSSGDQITVSSETFTVRSEDYIVPFIYAYPDSFLLGTFYDEKYGTTHADIFAQVEKPASYIYPSNVTIVPDSIYLTMYYQKYFGDKYSPMHISVYEMNKSTFSFTQAYPSNLNPADYTDKSLLIGKKTITAVDAAGKSDSSTVVIKLTNEFLQRFASATPAIYASEELFLNFFKGLHITTDFGSATMLYIKQINMEYFHHYTYTIKGSNGQDSLVKVNNVFTFPANQAVRQVNRFIHPDATAVRATLQSQPKQIHYVSSPANMFTKVSIPLRAMHQKMNDTGKRLSVNSARLRLDIGELDTDKLSKPVTGTLLLVKQNALNRFFAKKELPSDTVAVLGTYSYERNSLTNELEYFYDFDLSRLVTNEFKAAGHQTSQLPEFADFIVVPVRVSYNSNNQVTKIKHQILMNAVTLCGGRHPEKPMKVRTIFSGF
jgi:hypothetical protein